MACVTRYRFPVVALLLLLLCGSSVAPADEIYPFDHKKRKTGASLLECLDWDPQEFFTQPEMIAACQAVREKSLPRLEELQRSGIDWNVHGKDGVTVLLWALLADELPIFQQLLKWGADPNVEIRSRLEIPLEPLDTPVEERETVFHLCIRMTRKTEWATAALAAGGDVRFVLPISQSSVLARFLQNPGITMKLDMDLLKKIIDAGADLNHGERNEVSPVMIAIRGDHLDAAAYLIERGASVDCYDKDHWQAIHYLASWYSAQEEYFATYPSARQNWESSSEKKSLDQLVKLFEDRGHSFVEARVDFEKRFDLIDGVDYMGYRRRMRKDRDRCEAKSVKTPDAEPAVGVDAKATPAR